VLHLPRTTRRDCITFGRLVAREFWHAMCRLDTRPGMHNTTPPLPPPHMPPQQLSHHPTSLPPPLV
jgi:hypothetical protein